MHKYLHIFSMMLQQIPLVNWNIIKKIVADVIIYIMYTNMKKIINNPLNTINDCRRWWINAFMTEMMESFHNSNKSYFLCIRLAMISKQKITENLGGFILADSFHLSNKEKKPRKPNLSNFIPVSHWELLPLAHVLFSCWGLHLLPATQASSLSSGECQTLKSVHNKQYVTSVLLRVFCRMQCLSIWQHWGGINVWGAEKK